MYSVKRIEKYLNLAKSASNNSDFSQHKLGAVIVYHGTPLAFGCNSTKTSPVQKHYNRNRKNFDVNADYENNNSLHAEMSCLLKIRNLDIDFSKVSVFVYRQTANGKTALSRPCEACRTAMKEQGIKDVYYTTKEGWAHEHWN